jgi:L-lactate utilization protein LutC
MAARLLIVTGWPNGRVRMQAALRESKLLLTRQQMVQKIRVALGRTAGETRAPGDVNALPDLGSVLPPIAPADLITTFEDELRKVGGCTYRAGNRAEIAGVLNRILRADGPDRPVLVGGIVLSRNPLLARLGIKEIIESLGVRVSVWPGVAGNGLASADERAYREQCFSADAGVTGVDFALAESGSLVLTSRTEGSQLCSLAPPVHVALYGRRQVVGSLEEVLAALPLPGSMADSADGRSVVFVTGTSRTADIEQILVRGVHGPREVHSILVDWEIGQESQ